MEHNRKLKVQKLEIAKFSPNKKSTRTSARSTELEMVSPLLL